eukprot:jgi/Orpsp1_1/1191762/evm.model.d7180000088356.2
MILSEENSLYNLYNVHLNNQSYEKLIEKKIKNYISKLKLYYQIKDYNVLLNKIYIEENQNITNNKNLKEKKTSNNNIVNNSNNNNNNNNRNEISLQLKLLNTNLKEILLAPINLCIDENFIIKYAIDLNLMAVEMFHVHLLNGKIHDNFIYVITGEEKGFIKDFITRVRLLDEKIKQLIKKFIKNIQPTSSIYNLLKNNNVTENNNWIYNGIINGPNNNFMHISYEKSLFEEDIEGTPIYINNEEFFEMSEVLSLNSYCFIKGFIYPIFKLKDIIITEQTKKNKTIISFKSKAYFTEIYFKKGTVNCITET